MTFTHALGTNRYGEADLIVSTSASNGTHVTLASAMAAATSGQTIFLRDSVTENVTLTAGVNIAAWQGGTLNTPTITGTLSMTSAGTCNISGIRLVSNGAEFLSITGSAASIVNLNNCYLSTAFDPGITFSTSSSSAVINIINSTVNISAAATKLFAHSSAGNLNFRNCNIFNTGGSSTNSTCSAGSVNIATSSVFAPITLSGTAGTQIEYSLIDTSAQNTASLTLGGSAAQLIRFCRISSGTASSISVGGTSFLEYNEIVSSNANTITGAGTIDYGNLTFSSSSNGVNTTTQTPLVTRYGYQLSTKQPAFLGVLGTTATNKTGAGGLYTIGTDALTEIYDQNNDFNTNGTFTAPFTGKYSLQYGVTVTGCTVATTIQSRIQTSNRNYYVGWGRTASATDISTVQSATADMDAADTFTANVVVGGEAGNTDDITGNGGGYDNPTYMSGFLVC